MQAALSGSNMFSYGRSPEADKTSLEFHTHVLLRNPESLYFVCGFHPHTCKMPDTPQVGRNSKTKGIYWLTSSLLLISLSIMFVFILLVRIGLHSDHEMQEILGIGMFLSFFFWTAWTSGKNLLFGQLQKMGRMDIGQAVNSVCYHRYIKQKKQEYTFANLLLDSHTHMCVCM